GGATVDGRRMADRVRAVAAGADAGNAPFARPASVAARAAVPRIGANRRLAAGTGIRVAIGITVVADQMALAGAARAGLVRSGRAGGAIRLVDDLAAPRPTTLLARAERGVVTVQRALRQAGAVGARVAGRARIGRFGWGARCGVRLGVRAEPGGG